MSRKLFTVVPTAALAIAGFAASASPALAAGKAPSIAVTSNVAVGSTAHLSSTGLNPSLQVVVYKAQWLSTASGTGWTYEYYKGFNANADGTFAMDETENSAGQFRFQVCQYNGTKAGWNCSSYAQMNVA